ncbi:endonuclease 8-like 2 [Leucoraja erinacea]|uniref:endonuclease 8-like 2 n=1 Tax=Leucoraja erinaceus TaxID=7782 RepID=UPI00245835DC|nr:endonuclease 8-like 2 [Leucoraja erinacea]
MPEGPSVREFHGRCCRQLGAAVLRAAGGTRQVSVQRLEGRQLQQCQVSPHTPIDAPLLPPSPSPPRPGQPHCVFPQVHGKCLYLGFGDVRGADTGCPGSSGGSGDGAGSGGDTARDPRLWIRFHFGLFGRVRWDGLARAKRPNKRGDWADPVPRLLLHFPGGHLLAFYSCRLCECGCPRPDPSTDILEPRFNTDQALLALKAARPIGCILLDQRHFSGLGNIIKNEALYLCGIHPWCLGSQLAADTQRQLLQRLLHFTHDWLDRKRRRQRLQHHIYQRARCPRGHTVQRAQLGPPGGLSRPTWWCPVCQPLVPGPLG